MAHGAIEHYSKELVDLSQDQYNSDIKEEERAKLPADSKQYAESLKNFFRSVLWLKSDSKFQDTVIDDHVAVIDNIIKEKYINVSQAGSDRMTKIEEAKKWVKIFLGRLIDESFNKYEQTINVNLNHIDRTAVDNEKWDIWMLSMTQVALFLHWGLSALWWVANVIAWNTETWIMLIGQSYLEIKPMMTQTFWLDFNIPEWSAAKRLIDGWDPNDEDTDLWKWYNNIISPSEEWIESKQNQRSEFLMRHLDWSHVYSWDILGMAKNLSDKNISKILLPWDTYRANAPDQLSVQKIKNLLILVFEKTWIKTKKEFAETFFYLSKKYNKSLWWSLTEFVWKEWVDGSGRKHEVKDKGLGVVPRESSGKSEVVPSVETPVGIDPVEISEETISPIENKWVYLEMDQWIKTRGIAPETSEKLFDKFDYNRYKESISLIASGKRGYYLTNMNDLLTVKENSSPEKIALWKYQFLIWTLRKYWVKFTQDPNTEPNNQELIKNIQLLINDPTNSIFPKEVQDLVMEKFTADNYNFLKNNWVFDKIWYTEASIVKALAAMHFWWEDVIDLSTWKIKTHYKKSWKPVSDAFKTTMEDYQERFKVNWNSQDKKD